MIVAVVMGVSKNRIADFVAAAFRAIIIPLEVLSLSNRKGWACGITQVAGGYGLYIEWNPLRQFRAANGLSAQKLAKVLGVSSALILNFWEWRGIPDYRLDHIKDILGADLREPQNIWKSNGPIGVGVNRIQWLREAEETLALRVECSRRAEERDRESVRVLAERVAGEIVRDKDAAAAWLNEHEAELEKDRYDWHLAHAVGWDRNPQEARDDGNSHVDRIQYAYFERGGDLLSLEDYVIGKIDGERGFSECP